MVVPPEDGYGFVASITTTQLKNGGTGLRMGRHRMANRSDGYLRMHWNFYNERLMIHTHDNKMIGRAQRHSVDLFT